MGFIFDSSNLLDLKDSPFDKGKEITMKLIEQGVWIWYEIYTENFS